MNKPKKEKKEHVKDMLSHVKVNMKPNKTTEELERWSDEVLNFFMEVIGQKTSQKIYNLNVDTFSSMLKKFGSIIATERQKERAEVVRRVEENLGITSSSNAPMLGDGGGKSNMIVFMDLEDWLKIKNLEKK